MSERVSKQRAAKMNHEDAYRGLFEVVATFTCQDTQVLDMESAADKFVTIRNELIDRGSTVDHFRVILGRAIHDVGNMRHDLHFVEPYDFSG